MVEGAPLLREYTREGIVGSNPILSAIKRIFPDMDMLNVRQRRSSHVLAAAHFRFLVSGLLVHRRTTRATDSDSRIDSAGWAKWWVVASRL